MLVAHRTKRAPRVKASGMMILALPIIGQIFEDTRQGIGLQVVQFDQSAVRPMQIPAQCHLGTGRGCRWQGDKGQNLGRGVDLTALHVDDAIGQSLVKEGRTARLSREIGRPEDKACAAIQRGG